jgi:transposase
MIGPVTGVRVYLACGATDMRKGIDGLAAKAQEVLRQTRARARSSPSAAAEAIG